MAALLAFKEQAAAGAATVDVAPDEVVAAEAVQIAAAAVTQAAAGVQNRILAELRAMRLPPPGVSQVTEALAALFGLSDDRWATLKRRLDGQLLTRMAAMDAATASRLPRNRVERFQKLLRDHPAFADSALHDKCPAVVPLQKYCLAAQQLLLRLHGDTLHVEPAPPAEPEQSAEWGSMVSVRDDSAIAAQQERRGRSAEAKAKAKAKAAAKSAEPKAEPKAKAKAAAKATPTPPERVPVEEVKASPSSAADASGGPTAAEPVGITLEAAPQPATQAAPQPPARPAPSAEGARAAAALAATPEPANLAGLIVEPELWKLSDAELLNVRNLRVGRTGVGTVTFHGETDCRGLMHQLHELLVIEQGEVVVYPDARWKPPVGHGLNKPASVVLYGCMPKSQQRLADPKARDRYRQRVSHMTEEKGAVFEDYNCEDGTWKFRVTHF